MVFHREQIPERSLTYIIPTLFRMSRLIFGGAGKHKAKIVRTTLNRPNKGGLSRHYSVRSSELNYIFGLAYADELDEVLTAP